MGAVYWNKELCRYESITMSGSTSSSPYGSHQFSLDEPTNFDERREWWYELAPLYHAGHAKVYCTPRILVSTYAEWDCELLPITPATLTVEADCRAMYCWGLASIAVPEHAAHLYLLQHDGLDNCEFDDMVDQMVEVFTLCRLPTTTASVGTPEVTL